jgi:anaerobic selenocysteine-containing dehydrogenase
LGLATEEDFLPLRELAKKGLDEFSKGFMEFSVNYPELAALGAVALYETLGEALPEGMKGAAVLWFSAQQTALRYPTQVKAAGHEGEGPSLGNSLFKAMISNPDGVVFTRHQQDQAWDLLGTVDSKIHIAIPEMLEEVKGLKDSPSKYTSDEFPFVLAAGERRSFTANTIMRNPEWRKRDQEGTLRLSLGDAEQLGIDNGSRVRITTPGGSAVAVAEINETMMQGHISLPNGHGLSYSPAGGEPEVFGVPTNELTSTDWCDPIARTPWHKHVPAQLEVVEP